MTISAATQPPWVATGAVHASTMPAEHVLRDLGVRADQGPTAAEVRRRLAQCGPNVVSPHRARLLSVLWHQSRSPLLGLLLAAAVASCFVGQHRDATLCRGRLTTSIFVINILLHRPILDALL